MKPRRRRPARALYVLLIVLAALIGAVLYSGERLLAWAGLLVFSILSATFLWHICVMAGIRVQLHLPEENRVKGQDARMQIEIHNRSPFPVLCLELCCHTVATTLGSPPSVQSLALPPFSRKTLSFDMFCPYRGRFYVGVESVRMVDPLRLWSHKGGRRFTQQHDLTVWPRRVNVPVMRHGRASLDEKPIARRDHSEDLTSIHEIRSWRDGDPLKRIHWKLSERAGHWMVKEFDSTQQEEIAVILDARVGERQRLEQIRYEDALIESAISVCVYFLENGHPIRLSTYGDERIHLHGSSAADVSRFYHVLSSMVLNGFCGASEILEAEAAMLTPGGRLLVIGPGPDDRLMAQLLLLAGEQLEITLIIAVASQEHNGIREEQKYQLEQAGIHVLIAEPDAGIQPAHAEPATPLERAAAASFPPYQRAR